MLLIGIFCLALLLAMPAHAIPVAAVAAILPAAIAASSVAVAAVTFVLNTVIAIGLSFVSKALFKPNAAPGAPTQQQQQSTYVGGLTVTSRQAAAARVIVYGRRRVGGVFALLHSTDRNRFLHGIILLAGHEIQAVDEYWINDQKVTLDINGGVTDGPFKGLVVFAPYLGTANQLAHPQLISAAPDVWGHEHRLRGIAYVYVRMEWDPNGSASDPYQSIGAKAFGGALPNFTFVIRGKKDIRDPRTGTTGYSANPALCLANYLCDANYGIGVAFDSAIDQTALIAAANICDEDVPLAQGGTENRYECNGVLQSSAQPQENIGLLLGSMRGKMSYDGEVWSIHAGAYQTPTLIFTDDDLRAGMTVRTIASRRDMFTAVKGTYVEPNANWQEYDFPVVTAPAAIALHGTIYKDMQLPLTISGSMAQRIAKIELMAAQKPITVRAPCKLSVWRCKAGDTILWSSERYGWTNKPFEVRRSTFTVEDGAIGIDLDLAETAPGIYDWTSSEQTVINQAPATNLPDVRNVLPPSNLTIVEDLYETVLSSGVKASATMAWAASPDAFVGQYQPEYKLAAASTFATLPRVSGLQSTLYDLPPGTYDFRVAAVNHLGILSPYVATRVEVTGLGAAPSDAAGFTLQALGGSAMLRWDPAPDLDVRIGGQVVVRHSPAASGATWDAATPIGDDIPGSATSAFVPLKAGTYLLKFRDSSGVYSPNAAAFYTDQVALDAFATEASLIEDPTFTGAKTSCSVVSSKLRLTAGQASGSYAWSAVMDLGSVKRVRVTVGIAAQVINTTDSMDAWASVDARASWDTIVSGNEATALTYVSHTQDNPAGSPTWSPWARLDAAEFEARAFRFRTDFAAADTNFTIELAALSAVAESKA